MSDKIKVVFHMCDNDTGAFDTGIARKGYYTSADIESDKHKELVKGVPLLKNSYWSVMFFRPGEQFYEEP